MDYCGSAPVRYSTRGLSEPCASIGSPPCRCKVPTSRVIRIRGNQWVRLRETQRSHSHGAMLKSDVGVGWARRTRARCSASCSDQVPRRVTVCAHWLHAQVTCRGGARYARAGLLLPQAPLPGPDCQPHAAVSCCSSGTRGHGSSRCRPTARPACYRWHLAS